MKLILMMCSFSLAAVAGCRTASAPVVTEAAEAPVAVEAPGGEPMRRALPRAVVYKTDGDYRDNVPVTLNAAGTQVVSYPAPTDLTDYSTPLPLADGYLLDRRGVTADTRFTRYTYGEYRALPSVPSPAEILAHVIPGSRVTELHRLDMTPQQAAGDTAAVNAIILSGFKQR